VILGRGPALLARSLGQAVQELRPELDSKAVKSEIRKAEKQAEEDLEATKDQLKQAAAQN
jgi:hypothetical protein